MIDEKIVIYDYPHSSYLELVIKDDCFIFISEVMIDEDEYSEVHYSLNKIETKKVLDILPLDDFIEFAKKEHLKGILDFYKSNGISYITTGVY